MAVAFGTGVNGAFGSATVNKPASTAAGDLLIIVWFDGSGGTAAITGWTSGGHTTEPTSGNTAGFFWRIADGSEGASFTLTGINSGPFAEIFCVRYTGADQTTPINGSNYSSSNNAAIVTSSITTTVDGCVELAGISYDAGNVNPAPPAGWTRELNNSGNNWYFADRPQATHGATGTQDFSAQGVTTQDNIIVHIAVAPPSASTDANFGTRVTNPNPFVGPAVLRNRQFSGQHFELPNTNAPLTDTNFEFPQYRSPNVGPTALRVKARQPSLPINIVAPVTDTNPGTGTVAPPNPRVGPPALQRHFVQPVNIVNAPATNTNFEFPSYPPGQRFLPAIFRPYPFLPPAPVAPTGASVSVVPATGQLILTGFAPLLDQGLTPGTGSLVLTGFAPVLNTGLTPSTASLVLTGFAPTVATPVTVTPSTGTLVLTGFAPTIATPQTFTPTTAALVLTGFAPTITVAPLSTAVSGQFMLLGMG